MTLLGAVWIAYLLVVAILLVSLMSIYKPRDRPCDVPCEACDEAEEAASYIRDAFETIHDVKGIPPAVTALLMALLWPALLVGAARGRFGR